MRRLHRTLASLGLVLGAGGLAASGCSDLASDCEGGECANPTTSTTGTGGSGGDGGGGGLPTGCVPSEGGWAPAETCGIFVSSSLGQSAGAGTPGAPVDSVQAAVDLAESQGANAVYLCAEDHAPEAVTLPSGISLFGGIDCNADWAHTGAKAAMTAGADEIPLTVTGGGGRRIEDLSITAVDAEAAGGSSIAMLADQATADLARVDLAAGNGVAGADGPPIADDDALNGQDALNGTWAANCGVAENFYDGGLRGQKDCSGTDVSGGSGGDGLNNDSGGAGNAGNGPDGAGTGGLGGDPQTGGDCTDGGQGEQGTHGATGSGATGLGTLDATGYHGPAAGSGQPGGHGEGGGGGGGARYCDVVDGNAGPSGGGGGSGGCGGQGGEGGQAGGSSIALASVDSTLSLSTVTLTAASGADGGTGSNGQQGGAQGTRGTFGGAGACDGGNGGSGGDGGAGGGGLGGHSIGIAFTGTAPEELAELTITIGGEGGGGLGGTSSSGDAEEGQDGVPAERQDFSGG